MPLRNMLKYRNFCRFATIYEGLLEDFLNGLTTTRCVVEKLKNRLCFRNIFST